MARKKKQKGDVRKLTADADAYLAIVEQLDKHLSFVGDKSGRGGTRSWHCSHCYVNGAKPKQGSRSRQLAHLLGLQGEASQPVQGSPNLPQPLASMTMHLVLLAGVCRSGLCCYLFLLLSYWSDLL